jgi:hypothetical protein
MEEKCKVSRAKKAAAVLATLALLQCIPMPPISVQAKQVREEHREFPKPKGSMGARLLEEIRKGLSSRACFPRGAHMLIRK